MDEFEFFVIRNNTYETRDFLQRTAGVIGLAPDDVSNGDSFLTSLKKNNVVSKIQVGVRMSAKDGKNSRMTLGGIDSTIMFDYPSADKKGFTFYDDRAADKEWGTEVRNIYVGNSSHSFDSGVLTYAKVDTFTPFI